MKKPSRPATVGKPPSKTPDKRVRRAAGGSPGARTRAGGANGSPDREGRRYKTLMETATDGIHILDRNGLLVEANPAFFAMHGYERDELTGRPASDWDATFSFPELRERLAAFQPGDRRRYVKQHRRTDGSFLDVNLSATCVEWACETRYVAAALDITLQRQAELAVAAQATKLAEQLSEIEAIYQGAPWGLPRWTGSSDSCASTSARLPSTVCPPRNTSGAAFAK